MLLLLHSFLEALGGRIISRSSRDDPLVSITLKSYDMIHIKRNVSQENEIKAGRVYLQAANLMQSLLEHLRLIFEIYTLFDASIRFII